MLIYPEETHAINGAVFEVHKHLGPGLMEKVYQEALAVEFGIRKIPFEREKRYEVIYKYTNLNTDYIADFVCYDKIIVELKAVSDILDIHKAQVMNYLTITGFKLGLLYNFHDTYITPCRIVNNTI